MLKELDTLLHCALSHRPCSLATTAIVTILSRIMSPRRSMTWESNTEKKRKMRMRRWRMT
jgi:hypothetical protein